MSYVPPTHPETKRQLYRRSKILYREVLLRCLPFSFLIAFLSFLPQILILLSPTTPITPPALFSLQHLWWVVIEVVGLILFTMMLWRIHCVMLNLHETLKNDLMVCLPKLPRILGAALVETLMVLMLFFMTIGVYFTIKQLNLPVNDHLTMLLVTLPASLQLGLNIFIMVLLLFYLPLILTEDKAIFSALGKSASLIWGNWWRTLTLQLTPWCYYFLVLIFLKYIFTINIQMYQLDHVSVFGTLIHLLILTFFIPWSAAMLMVQLRDLELKKRP